MAKQWNILKGIFSLTAERGNAYLQCEQGFFVCIALFNLLQFLLAVPSQNKESKNTTGNKWSNNNTLEMDEHVSFSCSSECGSDITFHIEGHPSDEFYQCSDGDSS